MKTITMRLLPLLLTWMVTTQLQAQTYEVYIANEQLTGNKQMEFDVFIKSTGSTSNWALRTFQCGYQFSSAFVNGGTLSGAYVSGSSQLTESTFGKTWGFSWNSANRVLNQSANTGSTCPGANIGTTARKIGRFRVTNTANWGCADDAITMMTSGSGFLLLAVTKFNTLDCSDAGNTVVTSGATPSTSSPNASLLSVSVSAPATTSCDGTASIVVSASGGVSPYAGTGTFSKGQGTWSFTVTDARGCSVTSSNVIIGPGPQPTSSTTLATGCVSYTWNGSTYSQSGTYSYVTTNAAGCDSTAYLQLTITAETPMVTTQTSCDSYTWPNTGLTYTQSGYYTGTVTNCVRQVLDLTIIASSTSVTTVSSCQPYTWSNTGFTYPSSGTYTGSIINCVRQVLSLTIYSPATNVTTASGCDSYTWANTGSTYTQSGSYTGTTTNCVTEVLSLTIYTNSSFTAGTVSGASSICPGATTTFTSNGSAGGSWSSSNTAVATVNASTGVVTGVANGTATITYTVSNPCGAPYTATASISVQGFSISATITGPTNSCPFKGASNPIIAASNATYSITTAAASAIIWTVPTGATIMSGQGTNSIQVHFASTFSSGIISVAVANNCGSPSVTRSITVGSVAVGAVTAVAGERNVCDYYNNGRSITYTVTPVVGANYYRWVRPLYTTITSANADSSVVSIAFTTGFTSLRTKVISVSAVTGCGAGTAFSLTLNNAIPSAPAAIFGPANVCMIVNSDFVSGKDTTYYIKRVAGASSYTWAVPAGVSIISRPGYSGGVSSATDTLIVARISSTFTSGSITVKATNNCGSSSNASLTLTKALPSAPGGGKISVATISSVCPTKKSAYYISAMPSGGTSLVWTIPAGAILDSISPNRLYIRVTYPAKGTAYLDTVRVQAFNSCGASVQTKSAVSITACAPAIASGTVKGVPVSTSADTHSSANMDIKVYPNPTINSFRLQALSSDAGRMEVRVMDIQGRKLSQAFMMPGEILTLGAELRPGAYIVEVVQGTKTKTARVVKL